jgi:glycosyltransferase involved in cell wall biosynthesis
MQSLDVYVQPSLAEGISNTILEAMACGLPTIATSVGGNTELVIHNETGSLVPSADRRALSQALGLYVADSEKVRNQGVAARRRAVDSFSFSSMIKNYANLYHDTLE